MLPTLRKYLFNKNIFSKEIPTIFSNRRQFTDKAETADNDTNRSGKYLFILLPLTAFGLGTWQVQRLQWKNKLIEQRKQQMEKDPIELPKDISVENIQSLEHRRVLLEGNFLNSREMLVGPRVRDGKNGYWVITPFKTKKGNVVLINRGWIPTCDKELPRGDDKTSTSINAIVKGPPKKAFMAPTNEPERNTWYWVETDAMAKLANATPVLLEQYTQCPPQNQYPISLTPKIDLPNDHLQYAITWYSLGVALTAMTWKLFRSPSRAIRSKIVT